MGKELEGGLPVSSGHRFSAMFTLLKVDLRKLWFRESQYCGAGLGIIAIRLFVFCLAD